MKKRYIVMILIIILCIIFAIINKKNEDIYLDNNVLYIKQIDNISIKVQKLDNANHDTSYVGIFKSVDNNKTYNKVNNVDILVNNDAKFIFFNEYNGIIITNTILNNKNNYAGIKITHDGGYTFLDANIVYNSENSNLKVETIPYYEKDILKMVLIDTVTQEKIIFDSYDAGLNWEVNNL